MDIIVTAKDFEQLCNTQMQWNNQGWEEQLSRFTDLDVLPAFDFAFWFSDAASMILARHFLIENGHPFKQTWDEACMEYVLITDYVGSWDKVNA